MNEPLFVSSQSFEVPQLSSKRHVYADATTVAPRQADDGVNLLNDKIGRSRGTRTMKYFAYQNVCSFVFPGKTSIARVNKILFNLYVQTLEFFSSEQLWNIPNFKMMLLYEQAKKKGTL